jgi:hypothetical protein
MPLVNMTGLDSGKFTIYVSGFSKASGLTLQPSGTTGVLDFKAQTGTVTLYKVGDTGSDIRDVEFPPSQSIDGGRVYLFVLPKDQAPPKFSFATNPQPVDPPGEPYLYSFVELTNLNGGPPVVNLSTVDGLSFPMTLELDGGRGTIGQPVNSALVTRQSLIARYSAFMQGLASDGGDKFKVLELPKSPRANGQSEGLLNPYFYLKVPATGSSLPKEVMSPLNSVFDDALNTLFGKSGWSMASVYKGTVTNFTATAGKYQYASLTNPYSGSALMLPAIQLEGGGEKFKVFNPVGVSDFVGANGKAITASSSKSGELNQITLTNAPAADVLEKGMYAFGQFFDQDKGLATNFITNIETKDGETTITLKNNLPPNITNVQVVFSHLPYLSVLENTSGEIVFGNTGLFADGVQQGLTGDALATFGNIENQIVSAFNRGVAVVPGPDGPLSSSTDGRATKYWGTETNWYPAGQPENLFALFLHSATIKDQPIFLRQASPVKDARGNLMGLAYGFAFDEAPGPVPPVPAGQPNVSSKFEPVPDGAMTIKIILDPWGT